MANPLVEFNDSQLGVVLGSVLHTLGAIAFLGGLVGYLAWHRGISKGDHNRRVLDAAAFLTYLAIVVNLLGGFMRTFQTGHPHLTQFAESPWVRAIAIKHFFLFAAQGAAVYLFEVVAPRLVKAHKEGRLARAEPLAHRACVVLVALGILVAAVLGALTQVVPLVSADAPIDDGMHDGHELGPTVEYHNATGQLTSTPLQPATSTGSFRVPNATVLMEATLLWTPTQYDLRIELTDPAGNATTASGTEGALSTEADAPDAGPWTYSIASDLALNVGWTLSVRMSVVGEDEEFLAGTRTIPPGQFFEINTEMENRTSFQWDWTASATVHFDVHSHFDDEVQYHVEEDAAEGRGNFTNQRAGGYSFLWENTGTLPVTLDYRVWGEFTLDSVFPAWSASTASTMSPRDAGAGIQACAAERTCTSS